MKKAQAKAQVSVWNLEKFGRGWVLKLWWEHTEVFHSLLHTAFLAWVMP